MKRKLKIAINGLGTIGRLIVQTIIDDQRFQIVALNDPSPPAYLVRLLNHVPQNNTLNSTFTYQNGILSYQKYPIRYTQLSMPVPQLWSTSACDLLIEASGRFTTLSALQQHLQAGAKRVFLTTNFQDEALFANTLIYNFNHHLFTWEQPLWSFGSCTTNSLFLTLKACQPLCQLTSIKALSIHSATNQQSVLDRLGTNLANSYRLLDNLLPATSNAHRLLKAFFPNAQTHVTGLRIPTTAGSLLSLNLGIRQPISSQQLLDHLHHAQNSSFQISFQPLTLLDIRNQKTTAILDWSLTVKHKLNLQLGVWYDNEIGYVQQIYKSLIYFSNRLN